MIFDGGVFEWRFQNDLHFRILLLLIYPYKILWLQSFLSGLNSI